MTDAATTTTTDAATQAATAAAAAASAAVKPWFEGKVAPETVEFWRTKGHDLSDPVKTTLSLTEQYRNIEKLVGVKPEELVRWPKDIGDTDNWNNVHARLGVPKEAKDYDLSTVKLKDGKDIDPAFADMIRGALHKAKAPKESAAVIAKDLVAFQEAEEATKLAEKTAYIQKQTDELDKSWGARKAINMVIANEAWNKLGAATGLTAEDTKKGWDAISKSGAADSSLALKMLFTLGQRMGEAPFIAGDRTADPTTMSREGAAAEIESLKKDLTFGAKLKAGDTEAAKKWHNLHVVAFGQAA